MPQMAPINWLSLFIMFSLLFLLMNMMNYYATYPTSLKSSNKIKSYNMMNWKW